MNPLLFFSQAMLASVMDASIPLETRQNISMELAGYLSSEAGAVALTQFRESVEVLSRDEVENLDPSAVLWILENVSWAGNIQTTREPRFLRNVCFSSHSWFVRLRAIETLIGEYEYEDDYETLLGMFIHLLRDATQNLDERKDLIDLALASNYQLSDALASAAIGASRSRTESDTLLRHLRGRLRMIYGKGRRWKRDTDTPPEQEQEEEEDSDDEQLFDEQS